MRPAPKSPGGIIFRVAAAGLLASVASQSAAQGSDVLLRCTTGPGLLSEPLGGELPPEELLIRISGTEWREWSERWGHWSNDLCARRETTCDVTPQRLVRTAYFAAQDDTAVLERTVDRRTGTYRSRLTTNGRNAHVQQWEGSCEAVDKQDPL